MLIFMMEVRKKYSPHKVFIYVEQNKINVGHIQGQ